MADQGEDETFPWHLGVFDAHCHPTDTMASMFQISSMKASALTIMSTRAEDQHLVEQMAGKHGISAIGHTTPDGSESRRVVPSFGMHPWFSHQIYDDRCDPPVSQGRTLDQKQKIAHYQTVLTPRPEDSEFLSNLADPLPLSRYLFETRERLTAHPRALVGEVGLDKSFRIPEAWLPEQVAARDDSLTPGGREGRRLSPYRVQLEHQKIILLAQLKLAGELVRAVSVHGVQAHGVLFETLQKSWKGFEKEVLSKTERKRRASASHAHIVDDEEEQEKLSYKDSSQSSFPPRICLHSYSGPPDFLDQYLHPSVPAEMFFSFSMLINFSSAAAAKSEQVIKALPADKILLESDLHIAGHDMDQYLKSVAQKICAIKGWSLHDGVSQLARNWRRFVFASEDKRS